MVSLSEKLGGAIILPPYKKTLRNMFQIGHLEGAFTGAF